MEQSPELTAFAPKWIERRPTALDFNGPANVPYDLHSARDFETIGGIEVIERIAGKVPNKVAVDDGSIRLTYRELIDRVYGLASHLMSATEPGVPVVSIVPNTVAAPIIIMACALSGRVLVPIDASHPLERQEAIFAQSGGRAVVLPKGGKLDSNLVPSDIPRIVVDPQLETGASRPAHRYDPGAPLFVSFTSGSTGRPKGVVSGGLYGGIALRHYIDMFHLNSSDVVAGLASLSTGGSRDTFAALGVGATIRLFDIGSAGLSDALRAFYTDKVTILSFVPSALRAILSIDGAEHAFQHLRVLDLHGERILASDIALFRSKLPRSCHISVTMGSIEAGALFSWFVQDDQLSGPVVPVGYLMPGRRVALLDEEGRSVADGDVGELFARGAMAMGAWQNGGLIQGPFVPDPDDPTSSIYPMGDLMRIRPNGLFEYVGRKDRKMKLRGLWVDLGEVEAALRTIDGVSDAVVVSDAASNQEERLAAFIVMAKGVPPPSPGTVRHTVVKETADHMAPAILHVLDSIPRLANFKPDLVRLRAMLNSPTV